MKLHILNQLPVPFLHFIWVRVSENCQGHAHSACGVLITIPLLFSSVISSKPTYYHKHLYLHCFQLECFLTTKQTKSSNFRENLLEIASQGKVHMFEWIGDPQPRDFCVVNKPLHFLNLL